MQELVSKSKETSLRNQILESRNVKFSCGLVFCLILNHGNRSPENLDFREVYAFNFGYMLEFYCKSPHLKGNWLQGLDLANVLVEGVVTEDIDCRDGLRFLRFMINQNSATLNEAIRRSVLTLGYLLLIEIKRSTGTIREMHGEVLESWISLFVVQLHDNSSETAVFCLKCLAACPEYVPQNGVDSITPRICDVPSLNTVKYLFEKSNGFTFWFKVRSLVKKVFLLSAEPRFHRQVLAVLKIVYASVPSEYIAGLVVECLEKHPVQSLTTPISLLNADLPLILQRLNLSSSRRIGKILSLINAEKYWNWVVTLDFTDRSMQKYAILQQLAPKVPDLVYDHISEIMNSIELKCRYLQFCPLLIPDGDMKYQEFAVECVLFAVYNEDDAIAESVSEMLWKWPHASVVQLQKTVEPKLKHVCCIPLALTGWVGNSGPRSLYTARRLYLYAISPSAWPHLTRLPHLTSKFLKSLTRFMSLAEIAFVLECLGKCYYYLRLMKQKGVLELDLRKLVSSLENVKQLDSWTLSAENRRLMQKCESILRLFAVLKFGISRATIGSVKW